LWSLSYLADKSWIPVVQDADKSMMGKDGADEPVVLRAQHGLHFFFLPRVDRMDASVKFAARPSQLFLPRFCPNYTRASGAWFTS
jgi:hypothetical protein